MDSRRKTGQVGGVRLLCRIIENWLKQTSRVDWLEYSTFSNRKRESCSKLLITCIAGALLHVFVDESTLSSYQPSLSYYTRI